MAETEPTTDADVRPPSSARQWLIYGGVALGGLACFGLITWLLGLGPFAYRQILYDSSQIYLLNLTGEPVTVTLDRGQPIEIAGEGAERTPILGGTTTLTTRDASGEVLEQVDVFVDGKPVPVTSSGERTARTGVRTGLVCRVPTD